MENPNRRNSSIEGIEENILAIIDASGVKDSHDLHDDRLSFLEAVRAACIVSQTPFAPSWKIFDAIFQILSGSKSLELAMGSYQLLTELDKCYPRVYLTIPDKSGHSSSGVGEFVVVKEAWSPFLDASETSRGGEGNSHGLIGPSRFSVLLEDISQSVNKIKAQLAIKTVEDMVLFQYLVKAIEADFLPRKTSYKETLNWILFSECILNMLLGSRKLNLKSLVRGCMSTLCNYCHHNTGFQNLKYGVNTSARTVQDTDVALTMAITELEKRTSIAVQKLLTLIMELDVIRKEADIHGLTSRVDSLRTPVSEIILDELTYTKDHISPFFMMFCEPRWKLELILQYFLKFCTKPSIRTRSKVESLDDATFKGVLDRYSTPASTKAISKKISVEVAQLLLAHAFQAYLSVPYDLKPDLTEKIGNITLKQICSGTISAFRNLRKIDEDLKVASFEKEAVFTAAMILSQKS